MKRILFLWTLLSVLMFSLFTSCKKDDADDDFQVRIENYSNETVSFYVDGKFQNFVQANYNYNQVIPFHIGKTATFEVRSSSGKVLDSKVLRKGDSYVAIINPSSSDETVSDTRDEWSWNMELTNSGRNTMYVYVDGALIGRVESNYRLVKTFNMINQNSSLVEVKTAEGDVIDKKTITRGSSYVTSLKDLPANLYVYNSTSDSYMIYIDDKYVCTVSPYSPSYVIELDLGLHKLYAKQKDGYILWATEVESSYNFTEYCGSKNDLMYEWDFAKKKISCLSSVG